MGRRGEILHNDKALDPLLLLALRRRRHSMPALLEDSDLELLVDKSDDDGRRRLPCSRLLLVEDPITGLHNILDLGDRAQVACRLGRRQQRLENPIVDPRRQRGFFIGGHWEVEYSNLRTLELLLPKIERVLDASQLSHSLLLEGLKLVPEVEDILRVGLDVAS